VIVKYKNKKYSSEDLPIFLYFNSTEAKRIFINDLANYNILNQFVHFTSIDFALLGNTAVKSKRAKLYISLDSIEEKKHIQRYLFNSDDESNAVISTPPDIRPRTLEEWIRRHLSEEIS